MFGRKKTFLVYGDPVQVDEMRNGAQTRMTKKALEETGHPYVEVKAKRKDREKTRAELADVQREMNRGRS
ncbi:hypothetical protein ABT352_33130 [Streptosporangium sp. NPDC000563]|uniref:hypothetical protein n=1 Tax=Streptosporangium sp. NPDC000563 TaxID=3154366 RepID=UPI00332DA2FC